MSWKKVGIVLKNLGVDKRKSDNIIKREGK